MKKNNEYVPKIQYNKYHPITEYNFSSIENEEADKEKEFREKLNKFQMVSTLGEAKDLLQKIMPAAEGRTAFYVGGGKCTIFNSEKQLRISFDTTKEFISYDFV